MKNNDPLKPDYHVVIQTLTDEDSIDEMDIASWHRFKRALRDRGVELDTFAKWVNDIPIDQSIDPNMLAYEVAPHYELFREQFREQTGIGIMIGHHDKKRDGSPYDDVDGVLFILDNDDLYQFTENGKNLGMHLSFFAPAQYVTRRTEQGDEPCDE